MHKLLHAHGRSIGKRGTMTQYQIGCCLMLLTAIGLVFVLASEDSSERRKEALEESVGDATCVWWNKYDLCICRIGDGGFIAPARVCEEEWKNDRRTE